VAIRDPDQAADAVLSTRGSGPRLADVSDVDQARAGDLLGVRGDDRGPI
jgi:hypothetical protein